MPQTGCNAIRLLLIGTSGSEFRLAGQMAAEAGANVTAVGTTTAALAAMRTEGADLAMIDVQADVAEFIMLLRRERMALPVYACGVDAPAWRAVAAIRAGAVDFLPLPPDRDLIAAAIIAVGSSNATLIGSAPGFRRAASLALALAPARTPFIITGEPGSGRELLARKVHAASGRQGRFIVIDCLAVDPTMINSELFGHGVGTFPGAVADRQGRIEAAQNGTLFIDEVTLLPLETQSRLAQWLADRGRAGHGCGRPARVIASTAFDLETSTADGRLRPALLAQLGLVRVAVPPLRERGEDLAALVTHFGERFAAENELPARPFSAEAMTLLHAHDWSGNVAELAEVVHRAVLISTERIIPASAVTLADGGKLRPRGGAAIRNALAPSTSRGQMHAFIGSTVVDVERALILETLKACSGNRTSASTILGISVRTMRNKLKTFLEAGSTVSPTQ